MNRSKESHGDEVAGGLGPGFETSLRVAHRRLILLLVLGTVALNLALDGVLGWALLQSRAHYEKSAETNIDNISTVLEQNLLAEIREIDLTLQTVADQAAKTPSAIQPGNRQFASFLNIQASRIPSILGLRVADPKGNITYATGDVTPLKVNVADRDHFIRVRDDPKAGLVIGKPILGRITNKWVLILSRRLSCRDGSFCGEVHASMPLDGISSLFSTLDLGPHGVVSMWNKTTTLARYPEKVGERSAIGSSKPSRELKEILDANTEEAIYRATAPTDNVQKTYSIHRLGKFPLWVIVGLAEQDYLLPWSNEVRGIALMSLLFTVISALAAWQIYRFWRVNRLRMSELLIRESNDHMNEAQALAHIGSWIRDLETGKYTWSDEAFRIFGYPPQSLVPDVGWMLAAAYPDDRNILEKELQLQAQGAENRVLEYRIVQPGGSVRWVHVEGRARPGATGEYDRVAGFIYDITERKLAEETLIEHQRFSENLIQNSSVATLVLDRTHRIMTWNKACEELTGYPASAMIGTDGQWKPFFTFQRPLLADLLLDKDIDGFPIWYKNYTRSALNPDGFRAEGWYQGLGGKDRYMVIEAAPIYSNKGELIAAIETFQDITQNKRLEEQLLQSQKIEAIGQLAGGVAHDFNNILSAIVGYSHLTLMKLADDDPLRRNTEQILHAADRATTLTQSLLSFSRKQVINLKPDKLDEIVRRIEKLLLRLIREDIEISTRCEAGDMTILADGGQIEQIVMNLVTNARDAMPKGGKITIRTETACMDEKFIEAHGFGSAGEYVLLSVSDTGEGMDAATRERMFEPFFTTKEPGKGTGLGLSMVYGIVKQHNGFINVQSEPGKGTTFSIYLPLYQGAVKEEKKLTRSVPVGGGSETILIAEDDAALRQLASTVLRNSGYRVIESVDGEDAVAKYSENRDCVQLIILDGIMPKKNGREVFDEIRMITPAVKAIFVSGYAEDIISKAGLLDPGINFMLKPVMPSDFLKEVRRVLDA